MYHLNKLVESLSFFRYNLSTTFIKSEGEN